MAPRPESQERQASATGRHLDTANRCLVRQLRVLSRIGRHPAAVKLAEAVFKTMLETQETMVQTHELLTHSNDGRELRASSGRKSHPGKRVRPPELDRDGRPKSRWEADHEATWLLGRRNSTQRAPVRELCNEQVSSLCQSRSKSRSLKGLVP